MDATCMRLLVTLLSYLLELIKRFSCMLEEARDSLGDNMVTAVKHLILSVFHVCVAVLFIQIKAKDVNKDNNGGLFLLQFMIAVVLLFVIVSWPGKGEATTIYRDHETQWDLDDVRTTTEDQKLEVEQIKCIWTCGATDINLGSDEAEEEEKEMVGWAGDVENEAAFGHSVKLTEMDGCSGDVEKKAAFGQNGVKLKDMDGCSDDVGNKAAFDQSTVKIKDLERCSDDVGVESKFDQNNLKLQNFLKAVLMVFLPLITKGNMRRLRDTMNATWNGTAPRRESWKELLRSLHDSRWLAGCYSHYQQVRAVPFTQFDDAIEWVINFIRRIIIPIQETDHGDGFVSLANRRGLRPIASSTIPIQVTDHGEGFVSLVNARGLGRLASSTRSVRRLQNLHQRGRNRCLDRRSFCQPNLPLANSVSAFGSEPIPANSCSAVGSVSGDVGATTPGQVDAVTLHTPEVSALAEENVRLRRQRDCEVCLCRPRDVMFMPCSHLVCCKDCSEWLTECSVCRRHIDWIVDVRLHPED